MHTTELQLKLLALSTSELKSIAKYTRVAERTLWNIRSGKTQSASEWVKEVVTPAADAALKGKAKKEQA